MIKGRKQISLIYKTLIAHDDESSREKLEAWRLDTLEIIEIVDWDNACLKAQKQSILEGLCYHINGE